jgi:hypothetical protein
VAQLGTTTDRTTQRSVTTEDLGPVAAYLIALAGHGYRITSLALRTAENTDPDHPIGDVPHGANVQAPSATHSPLRRRNPLRRRRRAQHPLDALRRHVLKVFTVVYQ